MMLEKEFIRQRFHIVSQRLDDPAEAIERVARYQLQRERRLLGKILAEIGEGQVAKALAQWRGFLGDEWSKHQERRREESAPFHQRPAEQEGTTTQSGRSSFGAQVEDKNGYVWVIDDRFLAMLDDLIDRLEKWMAYDD